MIMRSTVRVLDSEGSVCLEAHEWSPGIGPHSCSRDVSVDFSHAIPVTRSDRNFS